MHVARPVHTLTKKSLADHKLEIYRRIICELIATEIDDDATDPGSGRVAHPLTPKN